MKNLLLLLPVLIFSCSKNKAPAIDAEGVLLKIGKNKTITYSGIAITVTDIRDNRCPKNVQCIRAGEALVDLAAAEKGAEERFTLCVGADCNQRPGTTLITLAGIDYSFALESVTPYPGTVPSGQPVQQAAFRIKRVK